MARNVPAELAVTASVVPVALAPTTSARTAAVIVLVANAPAPDMPTPAVGPKAAEIDAACAVALMSD